MPIRVAAPREVDHRGHWGEPIPGSVVTAPPRAWPRWLRERGETWDGRRLAARAVEGWTPDLIWERHSLLCDGGQRIARQLDIPRWVELNAPLSIERPGVRDRMRAFAIESASLRAAERVIAVSAWLANWAVDTAGCRPERVRHVPNGTRIGVGDRMAGRAALGVDGLVFGFVGSCRPWHRLDRLPAILDALPGATAVVIGDGPAPPPAHPRLRLHGRVAATALPDLVSALDVGLVLPAPADQPWRCPMKVLDYRAAGVPVVHGADPEVRGLVQTAGVQVGGESARDWADAIRAAAALPRAVQRRSWDQVLEEAIAGR